MSHPATLDLHPNVYTVMGRAAAFMPEKLKVFFVFGKFLLEDFLSSFGMAAEVYLRKRFGVRALSLFQVVQLVVGSLTFAVGFRGVSFAPLLSFFLLGAAGFAVYHAVEARLWERRKRAWRHTFHEGDPLPALWARLGPVFEHLGVDPAEHLTVERVVRFYEPLLVLVSGILLLPASSALGGFLVLSAAALFGKAAIRHQRQLDNLRDLNDGRLTGVILSSLPDRTEEAASDEPFIAQIAIPPILQEPTREPPASPRMVKVECRKCESILRVMPGEQDQVRSCPKCGKKFRLTGTASAARPETAVK
ncbi:MAG TPA: hypothetical protein VHR66_02945 [Gemmataceae bacterium]|jgi:hypothetical protein|nr:hypothetical protein [Gemmataceae bacterium]